VFYEKVKHHFAEFVLNLYWEIVKEAEKILEADQLTEILCCCHHFHQEVLEFFE
jgi:hypothetical protein